MTDTAPLPARRADFLHHFIREPLVHFLALGFALFLFFGWTGSNLDPASRTIVIDEPKVEQMAARWTQVWQRAPTPAEIDAMIRDHVREEIYYREAVRIGLDTDDVIIRRRLRNKMEYLARAELDNVVPTDAELQKWLSAHPAHYAAGAKVSFDQVYLGPGKEAEAKALLAELRGGADWRGRGERIALPISVETADRSTIAHVFGDDFARDLLTQPPGSWEGPIHSGFGLHLVRVRSQVPGKPAALEDVRQAVENDWRAATAKAREDRAYQALLGAYHIRIAKP